MDLAELESQLHSVRNDVKVLDAAVKNIGLTVAKDNTGNNLQSHVDQCALRYQAITSALKHLSTSVDSIKRHMWATLVGLVMMLLAVIGYLYVEVQNNTQDRFTESETTHIIQQLKEYGVIHDK